MRREEPDDGRFRVRKHLFGQGMNLFCGSKIVGLFAEIHDGDQRMGGSRELAKRVTQLLNNEGRVAQELTELRALKARCIRHLDDCALEQVTGRPWQEFRR